MSSVNPKENDYDQENGNPYFNEEEKKEDAESDKKLNNIEIELEEIA